MPFSLKLFIISTNHYEWFENSLESLRVFAHTSKFDRYIRIVDRYIRIVDDLCGSQIPLISNKPKLQFGMCQLLLVTCLVP